MSKSDIHLSQVVKPVVLNIEKALAYVRKFQKVILKINSLRVDS